MRFALVPPESKNKINKAGRILVQERSSPADAAWAIDLAERWRACHAYPINTFQATLRAKLRGYGGEPIAAQRLKRMPTIIRKLKRYPAMKLTTMQDIGGVRAILGSLSDVYALASQYQEGGRFQHELITHRDYVQEPRDEDGYRSVHLVYSYRSRRAPAYSGLRVELQIRTGLQHAWATAVETTGTFLGQDLKSRMGEREWLDFFVLVSAIFASEEGTPPPPRFEHSSADQLRKELSAAESRLNALEVMQGLSLAAKAIGEGRATGTGSSYHLIVLDSLKRRVAIRSYDRDSLEQAVRDYGLFEERAAEGELIEPVLVSAGRLRDLRRAYPNFFLDMGVFYRKVRRLVR